MRKFLWLWLLLLLPALLIAQEDREMQSFVGDFGVGQDLSFGETAVSFLGVVSDSRCPKRVICIWAGEAKVLLGIKINGEYFEKEVTVSGGGTALALSGGLQLQVLGLKPYLETGTGIPQDKYCLEVSAIFPL